MKIVITLYSDHTSVESRALAYYLARIDLAELGAKLVVKDGASVPVMVFTRNGAEVLRQVGLVSTEEIIENIKLAKAVR